MPKVRLRFAPSPTGPLHLGGVRTALFSYLFAKKHKGDFVLRIEDTDQSRYVPGAEEYIYDSLEWCNIAPDESPKLGGKYGPYKQSERLEHYQKYAFQLVKEGKAYYAFDTKEEIEAMRLKEQEKGNHSALYGHGTRDHMRNSLTLPADEVQKLLDSGEPFVIRLLVPESRLIDLQDMIRGEIQISADQLDDKVLLKQDGFPTYHLAVVVDDYMMEISHVFRGEEWLPSAPFHVLLWEALGWKNKMPKWAHLPLILKPQGNGKLSKRDGDKLGFPVFPLDWKSPDSDEVSMGYKSMGFIPEGFVNMLALLGWHPGDDQEVFSLEELIQKFEVEEISHSGARFDFQKGVWYNQQHIAHMQAPDFATLCVDVYDQQNWTDQHKRDIVPHLIHDRISLLPDIVTESDYFFVAPQTLELDPILKKWDAGLTQFFEEFKLDLQGLQNFTAEDVEKVFKDKMNSHGYKPGAVMLPLRIMLVGAKRGVGLYTIAEIIGQQDTLQRIDYALNQIKNLI